uniref:Uncharacterized protein n=1 Tax=Arundo donax TaxID=35708 RepID=A0A0A8Y403_ARUDO
MCLAAKQGESEENGSQVSLPIFRDYYLVPGARVFLSNCM